MLEINFCCIEAQFDENAIFQTNSFFQTPKSDLDALMKFVWPSDLSRYPIGGLSYTEHLYTG